MLAQPLRRSTPPTRFALPGRWKPRQPSPRLEQTARSSTRCLPQAQHDRRWSVRIPVACAHDRPHPHPRPRGQREDGDAARSRRRALPIRPLPAHARPCPHRATRRSVPAALGRTHRRRGRSRCKHDRRLRQAPSRPIHHRAPGRAFLGYVCPATAPLPTGFPEPFTTRFMSHDMISGFLAPFSRTLTIPSPGPSLYNGCPSRLHTRP